MSAARWLRLVFSFALLGALAACSDGSEPGFTDVQIADGEPITIGVSTMLEGDRLGTVAEHELYITLPSPPLQGPAFEQFDSDDRATYGNDPRGTSFTAESFDAATAIVKALPVDGVVTESDEGGVQVDEQALIEQDGAFAPVTTDRWPSAP